MVDSRSDSSGLILPGRGYGRIRFGVRPREVTVQLGNPEEVDDADTDGSLLYVYPSLGIRYLSFDKEEELRLTEIELSEAADPIIWGQRLFSFDKDGVERMVKGRGHSWTLDEIQPAEAEQVSYSAEDLGLSFYFGNDGELNEVTLSVIVGPDNEVRWP